MPDQQPPTALPTTAALDPWLTVVEVDEARGTETTFLFGYALAHHRLGAPAWMTTGVVVSLDERRAVTASGSIYALGRRIRSPEEIRDAEGETAFRALVLCTADQGERTWLEARRAARELGLPLPFPDEAERFLAENAAALALLRLRTAAPGRA